MDKRKRILSKGNRTLLYVAAIAGIIILSSTISFLVETATASYTKGKAAQLVEKMGEKDAEAEAGGGQHLDEAASVPDNTGPEEVQEGTAGKTEEGVEQEAEDTKAENEKKEAFDKSLAAYRKKFDTEIKGSMEDIEAFLDGGEEAFKLAVADYIFSTFGDVTVDAINIKGLIPAEDNKPACRISLEIGGEELPYICVNNKGMGFFSLYSPQELQ